MSLSQVQQPEDLYDQIVILVGSAIRLFCGEAGVFVVSNEAFDPLSSAQYSVYRLSDAGCTDLLIYISGQQPDSAHPFVVGAIPSALVARLGMYDELVEEQAPTALERC